MPKFIPASEGKQTEITEQKNPPAAQGHGYRPSPAHIRSSTLRDSFERAKKLHSTLAVQKQHSQSSLKAQHNFAPASRLISPGKARGEEHPDNNEAISVLSDIFPVSHSEFALVGGVDGAGKRALEVKQSSLVLDTQK